jgi:hypothetical protein
MGTTPFNERYDTTRREIKSARKDLRGEGWSRLFSLTSRFDFATVRVTDYASK